jgi:hypothetical protein
MDFKEKLLLLNKATLDCEDMPEGIDKERCKAKVLMALAGMLSKSSGDAQEALCGALILSYLEWNKVPLDIAQGFMRDSLLDLHNGVCKMVEERN